MAKYYIIPKLQVTPYKRLLLAWHTGIDPAPLENGDYILNKEAVQLLDNFPFKTVIVNETEVNAKVELLKYPLVDEKDLIFKQTVAEQEIIKGK